MHARMRWGRSVDSAPVSSDAMSWRTRAANGAIRVIGGDARTCCGTCESRILRGERKPTKTRYRRPYTHILHLRERGGNRVYARQDGRPQQIRSQRPASWPRRSNVSRLDVGGRDQLRMLEGGLLRAFAANRMEAATPLHARSAEFLTERRLTTGDTTWHGSVASAALVRSYRLVSG